MERKDILPASDYIVPQAADRRIRKHDLNTGGEASCLLGVVSGKIAEMEPRSAAQTTLKRRGFIVLNQFLDAAELTEIQPVVDLFVSSAPAGSCQRPHNTLLPLRWNDRIVQLLLGSDRQLQALTESLNADDLKWISGYVSIKQPYSPPLWWHQDWWCWDHPVSYWPEAPQVAVLCYTASTDENNGALRVLPGSHHRSSAIHAVLPEPHGEVMQGLDPEHPAMRNYPEQVTLKLQAGDAVAIDYRLLHGTHANAGNVRRDSILLSFTPFWRSLPDDVRGHLIRHPALPSDEEGPLSSSWGARILPRFGGTPRDLPVNRRAPHYFAITDSLSQ